MSKTRVDHAHNLKALKNHNWFKIEAYRREKNPEPQALVL
jgi:hypothetical protein